VQSIWKFCVWGALVAVVSGCGGGEGDACQSAVYPAAPLGAASLLHVSAACPAEGADGSVAHPFAKIGDAIAKAGTGAAILIAPGTYAENVLVDKDISLVGSSNGAAPEKAGAVIDAPNDTAVSVSAGTALIRGLRIVNAGHAGILVDGAAVTIEGCRVEGTRFDSMNIGVGVAVKNNGSIILQNSAVTSSAGPGVFVRDAGAIILQNQIDQNQEGGVRLEHASTEVRIEGNELNKNARLAIGVFSSSAIILQNTISETQLDEAGVGDGIIESDLIDAATMTSFGPSNITAKDNQIGSSGRVGILCSGLMAQGIILQHNTLTSSGSMASITSKATFGAGVWLQAGAGSDMTSVIEDNTITGSKFVGLGLSGDTHGIILQNNTITETTLEMTLAGAQEIQIGDGINLFKGASAKITGNNNASKNGRFGIILDGANGGATTISGNMFNDNGQYGIILQNQPNAPDTTNNTTAGNTLGPSDLNPATPYGLQTKDFNVP